MTIAIHPLERDAISVRFVGLKWDPRQTLETVTSGSPPTPPERAPGTADWSVLDLLGWAVRGSSEDFYTDITGPSLTYHTFTRVPTSKAHPDDELAELAAAAEIGDERKFIKAADAIDWRAHSAEDYVSAVRLALQSGAHLKARQLATEGAERYPGHIELRKMAKVLAPPQVLSSRLPPRPDASADMHWLNEHGDNFRGQWIALKAGELLGSAGTFDELIQVVGNPRGRDILVTQVF